jgi:hypothetical protein
LEAKHEGIQKNNVDTSLEQERINREQQEMLKVKQQNTFIKEMVYRKVKG